MEAVVYDHWSDYWRQGDVHACTREFSPDARTKIAAQWKKQFRHLEDGSRILDLATGNGALLTYLPQSLAANCRQIEAIGVDLATVEQTALSSSPSDARVQVEFRGGIDVAALPFGDDEFDLVTSQFGIEYADLPNALSEACRVAKNQLVFLMHAAEGVVIRQNGDIVRQIYMVLDDWAAIDLARAYSINPCAETKESITGVFSALQQEIGALENPSFLVAFRQQFAQLIQALHAYSPANAITTIDQFEAQLRTHADRMAALCNAGRTERDLQKLLQALVPDTARKYGIEPFYSDGGAYLVGYWVTIWLVNPD